MLPGIETELKIALDPAGALRLERDPALAGMRAGPRRTGTLRSIYFDTTRHALAAAGIGLRLRKAGRSWVQTVKHGESGGGGLFSHREIERPAPGGRLALDGPDPDGAYAAIARAAGGEALAPVFETRIRRVTERLTGPAGGEVELAIDRGEIVAGDARVPLCEAELELVAGEVDAIYAVARRLFAIGPVRFATANKAARGYRLARGEAEPPPAARGAGALRHVATDSVETVARDIFRDCQAQIAANMVIVAETDDIEGPHQLRVGLRRLRTAFSALAPSLGEAAFAPLAAEAQRLGRVVGALRDIDVLIDEVVAGAAIGLDDAARSALGRVLEERRAVVRAEVRAALAAPEAVGFLFDLGGFIEGRGWLSRSDYSQSERLAAPIGTIAAGILDKRRAKVRKRGRGIRKLDAAALHELRKQLKKLRYAADLLGPLYADKKVAPYIRSLKQLQDTFGSINDAAMSAAFLTGSAVPGLDAPLVQRGVGWVLGTLAARVRDDRPKLFERWYELKAAKACWR